MTRKLRTLGLALVALFVVGAMTASAALAESQLTSDGPVELTGKDSEGEKATFTGFGLTASCQGEYTVGLENQTPHTFFDPSMIFVAIFTVAPHYTNCTAKLGESSVPDTVTMNGCDYLVHVGNGAEHWEVVCPGGQQIEMHSYSGSSHLSSICTIKVPGQTGISGGAVENLKEGGVEKLVVKEPLSSIRATKSGVLCGGSSETENASMDMHAVISGVNEEGKATGISITP
jgi:hypothetical protein